MSQTSFHIEPQNYDGAARLKLSGRLSTEDLGALDEAVARAESDAPTRIELNLAALAWLDSTALGRLLTIQQRCAAHQTPLVLLNTPPVVMKMLRLTNLDKVFTFADAFQSPPTTVAPPSPVPGLVEVFDQSQQMLLLLGRGLIGLDEEGRILHTNPEARALLGADGDDVNLHGRLFADLIAPPSDPEPWQPPALFEDTRRQTEVYLYRADGDIVHVSLLSMVVETRGERLGVTLGLTETEEIERARRALQATQRRLTLIASATSDALLLYDQEGRLSFANVAAEQLTGRTREELQNMDWIGLAATGHVEAWEDVWQSVLVGRTVPHCELLMRTMDGHEKWCSVGTSSVCENDGQRIGVLMSLRDINEQWRMRQQLLALDKIHSMSHLMTTLGRSLTRVLKREERLLAETVDLVAPDHPAHLKLIELSQAFEYADHLVDQLAACDERTAQPEHNPAAASSREPVSIAMLAGIVLNALAPRLEGIEVTTEWDVEHDLVQARPHDIYQMIFNVVLNAIEAMGDDGGRLTLKTESTPHEVMLHPGMPMEPPERFVHLSVIDTGPGMNAATRERAFEPFFTTKSDDFGVGLGLSLVYSLVAHEGGRVEIENAPEQGTCVSFYLPAAQPGSEAVVGDMETLEGGDRILIVDDEALTLNFTGAFLTEKGYRVTKMARGNAALECFRDEHEHIDWVVLDLNMPGLSGREVMDAMRRIDPDVRILVASGLPEKDVDAVRDEPNVMGVVHKPYRGHQLLDLIHEAKRDGVDG